MPKSTSLKLREDLTERIQTLAENRRRSAHWIMCEAIEQYVEREERREQLKRDAENAWEEYKLSGQHATFEEADAWLQKLVDGEPAEIPDCHS
ncbi:MAG: ribbon-helix-helix protein, CopG family [bacterium]